jgi:hypothetical protein
MGMVLSTAQAQDSGKYVEDGASMITSETQARRKLIESVANGDIRPGYLLTIESDPKTIKGTKYGYITGVLYGMPATGSGLWNDCPFASEGCMIACLFTSGHGGIEKQSDRDIGDGLTVVTRARLVRSAYFHMRRDDFWAQLIKEINALIKRAHRRGLIPAIRLNGTTDIKWEAQPVTKYGVRIASNIMEIFKDIQFYDYTKWEYSKRPNASIPANYHLTFSRSETNTDKIAENLDHGRNVAVVFGIGSWEKSVNMPSEWHGVAVIDANDSDLRFLDRVGVVCGLKFKDSKAIPAKGRKGRLAMAIDGGFVVKA